MQTSNGLTIHRIDRARGGFRVELRRPAAHDPDEKPFAVIERGDDGGWFCTQRDTRSPDVTWIIDLLDRAYGTERQRIVAQEQQQQQQRDRLNDSFTKDWQDIVDRFS